MSIRKTVMLGVSAAALLGLASLAPANAAVIPSDYNNAPAVHDDSASGDITLVGSRSGSSRSGGGSFRSAPSTPRVSRQAPAAPRVTTPSRPAPAAPRVTTPSRPAPAAPRVTNPSRPAPAAPRATTPAPQRPNVGGNATRPTPGVAPRANTVRPTTTKPQPARVGGAQARAQNVIGTQRPRAVGTSTRVTTRGAYGSVSVNRYMVGGVPYMGFYSPGFGYIYHNPFFWYWMLSPRERVVYAQQNNISEAQAVGYLRDKGYDVSRVQSGDESYLNQLSQGEEISKGEDVAPQGAADAPSLYEQAMAAGRIYANFCGGSTKGAYYAYGAHLGNQLPDMVIERSSEAGSVGILTGIDSGKCQIGISQNDVLYGEAGTTAMNAVPLTEVLKENAHLLCRKGITSIQALRSSGKVLAIGAPGSGGNYTWSQMVALDDSYGAIPTLPQGGTDALMAIQRGQADCLLSVTAPGSKSINELAKMAKALGFQLELASFDDGDFDNAKLVINGEERRVYVSSETDDEQYVDLYHHWGDPNTIEVGATVVVSKLWWNSLDDAQKREVLAATVAAIPHLKAELARR